MADHFMETVNLRFAEIDTRFETEMAAVEQHFLELREFITFGFDRLQADMTGRFERCDGQFRELKDGLAHVERRLDTTETRLDDRIDRLDAKIDRLDTRIGRLEMRVDRLESTLHAKIDGHFEATVLILRDIQQRLPPPV